MVEFDDPIGKKTLFFGGIKHGDSPINHEKLCDEWEYTWTYPLAMTKSLRTVFFSYSNHP